MSIVIDRIHPTEDHSDRYNGTIRHNGHVCEALLLGSYDRLQSILNTEASAEYDLGEILSVEVDLPKDGGASGIFPEGTAVIVDGTVHNEIVVDERISIFDIYIQNGADFVAVSTEELRLRPRLDTRIRILTRELHVYPTFT